MMPTDQVKKTFKEACHSEYLPMNIPSKRIFKYNRKHLLNITPTTLKIQSVKRIDARIFMFDSARESSNREILTLAIRSLKRMKNKKILLNLGFTIITTELHLLSEALKKNPFLQTLKIAFLEVTMGNESSSRLSKTLRKIRLLKHFKINFDECYDVDPTDRSLYSFSQGLKSLTHLQTIGLNFGDCWEMTNRTLSWIGKTLKNLTKLESANFEFSSDEESMSKGIRDFGKSLKRLILLKEIDFSLEECEGISDIELEILVESLDRISCLEYVELNFNGCQITDIGLAHLGRCFKKLENLKEIILSFEECDITQEGLQNLKERLEKISSSPKVHLYN